jgi:transcriptional pleiotropic repressor
VSSLLENTRRMGKLIQNSPGYPGRFEEIARTLAEVLESQVFVVAKNGKILGHSLAHLADDDFEGADSGLLYNGYMPPRTNEELLKVFETNVNRRPDDGLSMLCDETLGGSDWCRLTITPIIGGGERVGTLILSKIDGELGDSDIILTEYGATFIGMEIYRSKNEKAEEEARKRAAVQMALETLSYSEQEAVEHIFDELDGDEGLLVASKIADRVGITRSVIVNALRKFESAGVIESRSLGMKGTYIRVLNDRLFEELDRLRAR